MTYREMKREWERQTLSAAIAECGGPTRAARELGLHRTAFLKKLITLGLREKQPFGATKGNWGDL